MNIKKPDEPIMEYDYPVLQTENSLQITCDIGVAAAMQDFLIITDPREN